MADAVDHARALTSHLRTSLSLLKRDVATSLSLCGRDFGRLGAELVAALDRTHARERATTDALAHERSARGLLETQLHERQRTVRVLCRVRPPDPSARVDRQPTCVHVASAHELSVGDGATASKSFFFSRVFHAQQSQAAVFQEVAPLVQSALAGHYACVLAYGQTGAGKTHTMEGRAADGGLYDRASALIWATRQQQKHVYAFDVRLQRVEVYNEEIYDLLVRSDADGRDGRAICTTSEATAATCTTSSSGSAATTCTTGGGDRLSPGGAPAVSSAVEIRHGGNGVYLKNVETIAVSSGEEFRDVIARSTSSRTAALNDRSHRSHTVLTIEIRRTSKASGETDVGRLVLVDLAGSERLLKTAAMCALTVREAQHINKSLSAVGDVLSALLAKEKHVPFRNSKLTHLLQDSLSGSANRTLLLVHVRPQSEDVNETINSLKFASRVSHIQMGKSQRTERAEIARLNGVVANQVSQIQTLQEKLNAELELRKKYEKRLAEYRHEEHRRRSKGDEARRILQQMRTPSPPELPPPVSARRWSLYTRKVNAQGLNGIENIAENILRGNESSPENAEMRATGSGKPSGISPPTNFSRRLSLSALDQAVKAPARSVKRKRPSTSENVRSILKKQCGNNDNVDSPTTEYTSGDGSTMTSKQVSFDLSGVVIGSSSSALPSRELTTSNTRRGSIGGAVRVLAANPSVTATVVTPKVASTPAKRVKAKSIGWR
ncbi:unnamed protein product [Hyaloperonospora brassicae]|uniref:Kinesin-like protein n=1 Tax=Hyaloperonospora brassicae TaxID=162125 RepID=A0AAV0T6Y3_HYABA|nr:unnamed protein product [Hyaloperonospora brassicae]